MLGKLQTRGCFNEDDWAVDDDISPCFVGGFVAVSFVACLAADLVVVFVVGFDTGFSFGTWK